MSSCDRSFLLFFKSLGRRGGADALVPSCERRRSGVVCRESSVSLDRVREPAYVSNVNEHMFYDSVRACLESTRRAGGHAGLNHECLPRRMVRIFFAATLQRASCRSGSRAQKPRVLYLGWSPRPAPAHYCAQVPSVQIRPRLPKNESILMVSQDGAFAVRSCSDDSKRNEPIKMYIRIFPFPFFLTE